MTQSKTLETDDRIVMIMDAGGTSFRFFAMQRGKIFAETEPVLIDGNDLEGCLTAIENGFTELKEKCPEPPVAISFAFPGPCDYPAGVIGDLCNLPGFRGGVPLGPMLEEKFGIPTYINNDGDLFAYGEALGGFLPEINKKLEEAGNPKRYKNLFGVTFGTGFGGGTVRDGELFIGDNSIAGEIWCTSNILDETLNAEEGVAIRAVKGVYAREAGIPVEDAPDPYEIELIALGKKPGDAEAAKKSYESLGIVAGASMANALTLIDGLAVVGGGLSKAGRLHLDALVDTLNSSYSGSGIRRIASRVFNLEDEKELEEFLQNNSKMIKVPNTDREVAYDATPRLGVGLSKLGTSEAISVGAYAYALNKLDS